MVYTGIRCPVCGAEMVKGKNDRECLNCKYQEGGEK